MVKNNTMIWIIGIIVLVLLWQSGTFDGLFGNNQVVIDNGNNDLYPSDLKTTITLNTGDKLATTSTNANVSYYVFSPSGKFLKEGTTSAGTASFTVPTGVRGYKLIAYDDTSSTDALDYLPIETTFDTDGTSPEERSDKTVNIDLYRESNVTINAVQDPLDSDQNVSVGLGQTVDFDIWYSAELSKAAVFKPVIRIVANASCIESVDCPSLIDEDCPDRLTAGTDNNQYCFKDDSILESGAGMKRVSCNMVMDSSTTCDTSGTDTEHLEITILDTGIYKESDYKTKGYSAFKYGTENPADNSNIGAGDSATYYFGLGG